MKMNMRINRRRRRKRNIGIIEVTCIIVALLILVLLIAHIATAKMDREKQSAKQQSAPADVQIYDVDDAFQSEMYSPGHFANNSESADTQEQIVLNEEYLKDFLKDFHVVDSEILVTEKKFALSGRWFQTIINGEQCFNTVTQGAMVYFQIRGTDSFDIKFVDRTMLNTPYFAYTIDGGELQRQTVSENHIELPDTEEHKVTLVMDGMDEREFKWGEEIGFAFSDIDCHDGEMNGYIPKQKRILFLGDSIVEGCMTLGDKAESEYNSATHSVSWYTASALFAEPYFIGYGGSGIEVGGSFNTTANSLDYLSEKRPIPTDDYPKCDLIVLNTGTNDYETKDGVFANHYDELLQKLHEHYPKVAIVCVIPFNQTHAKQIRETAEQYDFAYTVETAGFYFSTYDGIHPDDEGAQKVAGLLVDFITKIGVF